MSSDINKEYLEVKEKLRKRGKLKALISDIMDQIDIEQKKQYELQKQMDKEDKDVEKLQKLSFDSIVCLIAGNKEEKLSKEKREAIEVKLRYDECCQRVSLLRLKLQFYEVLYGKFHDLDREYEYVKWRKRELLLKYKNDDNDRRVELEKGLEMYELAKCEFEEAIDSAKELLDVLIEWSIQAVEKNCYSVAQILLRGNLITEVIGDTLYNGATSKFIEYETSAEVCLMRLEREFSDIKTYYDGELNTNQSIGSAELNDKILEIGRLNIGELCVTKNYSEENRGNLKVLIYKLESCHKRIENKIAEIEKKIENLYNEVV